MGRRHILMIPLAALLFAMTLVGASAEEQPAPSSTGEAADAAGAPTALPIPPKPAVPIKKKRVLRRGDQGEKPTLQQVSEILEENGDLSGKDLRGLNLVGFNLRRANLAGATLVGANLERADLREANLERADLGNTNLRRATLRMANVKGANLQDADLEGAIWLDGGICGKGSKGVCRQ